MGTATIFEEKFNNILKIADMDAQHDQKRIISFELFDKILDGCLKKKCPTFDNTFPWLNFFTDISIASYIEQRAYFDYLTGKGKDDYDRYCASARRIQCVINCNKSPGINEKIFRDDSLAIFRIRKGSGRYYYNARRRKAFWVYMKNGKTGFNPDSDYYESCNFLEFIHKNATSRKASNQELTTIKKQLTDNLHIANPLDLYRICLIRKKIK